MKKKSELPTTARKVQEWKQLLQQELAWSVNQVDTHIHRLLGLFKQMQDGSATVAYRSKLGEVKLTTASLQPYARFFHRPFRWEKLRTTIPFWNEETQSWSTFNLANFIDWRASYSFR